MDWTWPKKARKIVSLINNQITHQYKLDPTPGNGSGRQLEDALEDAKKYKAIKGQLYTMKKYDSNADIRNPFYSTFLHLGKHGGWNTIQILNNTGVASVPKKNNNSTTATVRDYLDVGELSRAERRILNQEINHAFE